MKIDYNKWLIDNNDDLDTMCYKIPAFDQCQWIEQTLIPCVLRDFEGVIVSKHTSKSIHLPVFEFYNAKNDLRIVLRYNFYDWCLAISKPLEVEIPSYFDKTHYDQGFFEGMDYTSKYPFRTCMSRNESLFALLFWILNEGFNLDG